MKVSILYLYNTITVPNMAYLKTFLSVDNTELRGLKKTPNRVFLKV